MEDKVSGELDKDDSDQVKFDAGGPDPPPVDGWGGQWRRMKLSVAKHRGPVLAAILSLLLTWWVWASAGFRAVWPAWLVGIFAIVLFWFAIKPHYLKLIQLEYDIKRKAIYFGLWMIPHPLANEVYIEGAKGWLYGPDNEMVHAISHFDEATLTGKAHYPDNWTTARVIADINADRTLIRLNQKLIERYGAANAVAQADYLKYWLAAAVERDFHLGEADQETYDQVKKKMNSHFEEGDQKREKRDD